MGLITPPKDYYRLDEVAKKLGCSVEDLLMLGADGKLQFSIRLKPSDLVTKITLECSSCGLIEKVPDYSEVYNLSVNTLKNIWGDQHATFHPILVCSKCGQDLLVTYHLDAYHPAFEENENDTGHGVKELLVHFDNIKKYKELHCTVIDETQAYDQEERQNENQRQGGGKQKLAKLEEACNKLKEFEKDQDVIAAKLCDEYGAKG